MAEEAEDREHSAHGGAIKYGQTSGKYATLKIGNLQPRTENDGGVSLSQHELPTEFYADWFACIINAPEIIMP